MSSTNNGLVWASRTLQLLEVHEGQEAWSIHADNAKRGGKTAQVARGKFL